MHLFSKSQDLFEHADGSAAVLSGSGESGASLLRAVNSHAKSCGCTFASLWCLNSKFMSGTPQLSKVSLGCLEESIHS